MQCESLLQATFVIYIPFLKATPVVLDSITESRRHLRSYRLFIPLEAIARKGQSPHPISLHRSAGYDPDAIRGEIGAQIVGPIGGLISSCLAWEAGLVLRLTLYSDARMSS